MRSPIKGNFEITAGYEILHLDRPTWRAAGFQLFLVTETPTKETLVLAHFMRQAEGETYTCNRTTTEDGKRVAKLQHFPATSRSGRLRVTRSGTEVTCWAGEGAAGDFRELYRCDLGAEDLNTVGLGAYTGPAQREIDLRIIDLRVRADGLVLDQAADLAPLSAVSSPGGKHWLALAVLFALVFLLALGGWLYVRQGRAASAPAQAPVPDRRASPEAALPAVSFGCPGCGKQLRARAEMAGKKVKWPQCGQEVLVAATAP